MRTLVLAFAVACGPDAPTPSDVPVDTDASPHDTDAAPTETDPEQPDPHDTDGADTDPQPTDTDPGDDPLDTDVPAPADTGPICVDGDGDGFGVDCAAGPDCDDTSARCNVDCADLDADQVPECQQTPGADVLLYIGNGGGRYDIFEPDLQATYAAVGATADISETVPADLADRYGTLLVLSPIYGFPDPAPARALLLRGGAVIVSVEHGGYGDQAGASAWLAAVGSTMTTVRATRGGIRDLTVQPVPGVTDGVSALRMFFCADITVGGGVALGVHAGGDPGIGWEAVANGQVLVVPDGSFFGHSLDEADNARLLQNLAP